MFQKHKAEKLETEHKHQAAVLEAQHHRQLVDELRQRVASLPDADGVISPEAFEALGDWVGDRDIFEPDIVRTIMLGLAQGGTFVAAKTTLLLKKKEVALLDTHVRLLKEVTDREYRGASKGVSVPLGGGVRYRVGAQRGHMVTIGSHWATADSGALTITDSRIVYHGSRKTLEFPFEKLATLKVYTDALDLGVTTRESTSSFGAPDTEFISGMIHAVLNHRDDQLNIITVPE